MKRIIPLALFAALAIVQEAPAFGFQSGVVTYPQSGSGGVIAVTVNYNTRTITYHYDGGYQYTPTNVDFDAAANYYQQQMSGD